MIKSQGMGKVRAVPASSGGVRDWQRWTPYAAVLWSLLYTMLGIYWAVSGRGFPYTPAAASDLMGPLLGRLGPGVAWVVVLIAGIPAVAVGAAMLRGVRGRTLRALLMTIGVLLAGALLLLMTSLDLLVKLGYFPYAIISLLTGAEFGGTYLESLTQWATIHQFLCLVGGFLWLGASVCYGRRSGNACLYCGRHDSPGAWNSPDHAARWGSRWE